MSETSLQNPTYRPSEEDKAALKAALGELLQEHVILAKHTSFRIGGSADFFVRLSREEEMLRALQCCYARQIPLLVIGNGSNMLLSDLGWRGLVVLNRMAELSLTEVANGEALVKIGSGALLGKVARRLAKEGWAGFEFAATIPGSIGGGVVSNAGAHGSEFAKVLTRVGVVTATGECRVMLPEELGLTYRHSRWRTHIGMDKAPIGGEGNELILWAEFRLQRGLPNEIKRAIDAQTAWRREKQPQEPSGGSTFKNPVGRSVGRSAGQLIEEAGLKGFCIGKAQFSLRHANFIVNLGDAKSTEVLALIHLAQKTVQEKFGIELELEIELLGE
ncbi:MAG: UDP-N-acetylmuramate dehydrogenase [Chloroflexi bacterium]|nr:UDP-N-acetylmuramate dehydrogenase [Chloroflexota bacterium]